MFTLKKQWVKKPVQFTLADWANPLSKGLIKALVVNEGGGFNLHDAIGRKNATLPNTTSWVRDINGLSINTIGFTGGQGVNLGKMPELNSNEFTILMGVSRPAASAYRLFMPLAGIQISWWSDGNIYYDIVDEVNRIVVNVPNGYHNFAFTLGNGTKRIYDNGEEIGSAVESDTPNNAGDNYWFTNSDIGEHKGFYLYVYDRELNPLEIKSLHSNPYQLLQPKTTYITLPAAGGTVNSRTLSDNVEVIDPELKAYKELFKLLSENADLVDSIIVTLKAAVKEVTLSDNIIIIDNLIKFATLFKLTSDNIALSDGLNKSLETFKLLSENIDLSDSLIVSIGKVISNLLSDNLDVTDSAIIDVIRNTLKMLTDNVAVTDELLKSLESLKLLSDNINVTDDLIISLVRTLRERLLSDNVSITDSLSVTLTTALIAASLIKSDLEIKNIVSFLTLKHIDTDLEN